MTEVVGHHRCRMSYGRHGNAEIRTGDGQPQAVAFCPESGGAPPIGKVQGSQMPSLGDRLVTCEVARSLLEQQVAANLIVDQGAQDEGRGTGSLLIVSCPDLRVIAQEEADGVGIQEPGHD